MWTGRMAPISRGGGSGRPTNLASSKSSKSLLNPNSFEKATSNMPPSVNKSRHQTASKLPLLNIVSQPIVIDADLENIAGQMKNGACVKDGNCDSAVEEDCDDVKKSLCIPKKKKRLDAPCILSKPCNSSKRLELLRRKSVRLNRIALLRNRINKQINVLTPTPNESAKSDNTSDSCYTLCKNLHDLESEVLISFEKLQRVNRVEVEDDVRPVSKLLRCDIRGEHGKASSSPSFDRWMSGSGNFANTSSHSSLSYKDQLQSCIRQEGWVKRRVQQLIKTGMWSALRLPRVAEPPKSSLSSWNHILDEMQWMSVDFHQERVWKKSIARVLAYSAKDYVENRESLNLSRTRHKFKMERVAKNISGDVADMYSNLSCTNERSSLSRDISSSVCTPHTFSNSIEMAVNNEELPLKELDDIFLTELQVAKRLFSNGLHRHRYNVKQRSGVNLFDDLSIDSKCGAVMPDVVSSSMHLLSSIFKVFLPVQHEIKNDLYLFRDTLRNLFRNNLEFDCENIEPMLPHARINLQISRESNSNSIVAIRSNLLPCNTANLTATCQQRSELCLRTISNINTERCRMLDFYSPHTFASLLSAGVSSESDFVTSLKTLTSTVANSFCENRVKRNDLKFVMHPYFSNLSTSNNLSTQAGCVLDQKLCKLVSLMRGRQSKTSKFVVIVHNNSSFCEINSILSSQNSPYISIHSESQLYHNFSKFARRAHIRFLLINMKNIRYQSLFETTCLFVPPKDCSFNIAVFDFAEEMEGKDLLYWLISCFGKHSNEVNVHAVCNSGTYEMAVTDDLMLNDGKCLHDFSRMVDTDDCIQRKPFDWLKLEKLTGRRDLSGPELQNSNTMPIERFISKSMDSSSIDDEFPSLVFEDPEQLKIQYQKNYRSTQRHIAREEDCFFDPNSLLTLDRDDLFEPLNGEDFNTWHFLSDSTKCSHVNSSLFMYSSDALMEDEFLPPVALKADIINPSSLFSLADHRKGSMKRLSSHYDQQLDTSSSTHGFNSTSESTIAPSRTKYSRKTDPSTSQIGQSPIPLALPTGASGAPKSLFERSASMSQAAKMRREAKKARNAAAAAAAYLQHGSNNQQYRSPASALLTSSTLSNFGGRSLSHHIQTEVENMMLHTPDWLIQEDYSILCVIQDYLNLQSTSLVSSNAGHSINWDLVSDFVNRISRIYRGPRQCRLRFDSVIAPREDGQTAADLLSSQTSNHSTSSKGRPPNNPERKRKNKKELAAAQTSMLSTSSTLFGIRSTINSSAKTNSIYTEDDNSSWTSLFASKFEKIRAVGNKRTPTIKPFISSNPLNRNLHKHAQVMVDACITYDQPLSPANIAANRAERILREKQRRSENQRRLVTAVIVSSSGNSPVVVASSPVVSRRHAPQSVIPLVRPTVGGGGVVGAPITIINHQPSSNISPLPISTVGLSAGGIAKSFARASPSNAGGQIVIGTAVPHQPNSNIHSQHHNSLLVTNPSAQQQVAAAAVIRSIQQPVVIDGNKALPVCFSTGAGGGVARIVNQSSNPLSVVSGGLSRSVTSSTSSVGPFVSSFSSAVGVANSRLLTPQQVTLLKQQQPHNISQGKLIRAPLTATGEFWQQSNPMRSASSMGVVPQQQQQSNFTVNKPPISLSPVTVLGSASDILSSQQLVPTSTLVMTPGSIVSSATQLLTPPSNVMSMTNNTTSTTAVYAAARSHQHVVVSTTSPAGLASTPPTRPLTESEMKLILSAKQRLNSTRTPAFSQVMSSSPVPNPPLQVVNNGTAQFNSSHNNVGGSQSTNPLQQQRMSVVFSAPSNPSMSCSSVTKIPLTLLSSPPPPHPSSVLTGGGTLMSTVGSPATASSSSPSTGGLIGGGALAVPLRPMNSTTLPLSVATSSAPSTVSASSTGVRPPAFGQVISAQQMQLIRQLQQQQANQHHHVNSSGGGGGATTFLSVRPQMIVSSSSSSAVGASGQQAATLIRTQTAPYTMTAQQIQALQLVKSGGGNLTTGGSSPVMVSGVASIGSINNSSPVILNGVVTSSSASPLTKVVSATGGVPQTSGGVLKHVVLTSSLQHPVIPPTHSLQATSRLPLLPRSPSTTVLPSNNTDSTFNSSIQVIPSQHLVVRNSTALPIRGPSIVRGGVVPQQNSQSQLVKGGSGGGVIASAPTITVAVKPNSVSGDKSQSANIDLNHSGTSSTLPASSS